MEGVGEGLAGHDEDAPAAPAGVDRNFGRDLVFAHEAIFVQDPDGEFELSGGRRTVEAPGKSRACGVKSGWGAGHPAGSLAKVRLAAYAQELD